jgi:hypothetical protein
MMPKQRFHATVLAPRHAHDMLIDSDIGARLGDCRGHIPAFRDYIDGQIMLVGGGVDGV